MNTWLTSDTHFGHQGILVHEAGARPFNSVQEMDEALIQRWNALVRPGDIVWHLGDFSLSHTRAFAVIPRLNGNVHLVAGNHDACWTANPSRSRAGRAEAMAGRYLEAGFASVHTSGQVRGVTIASAQVTLSHLPSDGDSRVGELRYAELRPGDDLPIICGHVHSAWRTLGRNINVGVDVWDLQPLHEDDIADLLAQLPSQAR